MTEYVTVSNSAATPKLHVQLLGTFHVTYNQRPVLKINTPRLQSLLAYVLLHRRVPVFRQTIASLFWPDTTESQARTNLRRLLHQLKTAFPQINNYLFVDSTTISWNNASSHYLDVERFETSAAQAIEISELQDTMHLYSGDLVPHIYEEWVSTERERLGSLYELVLHKFAEQLEKKGDYAGAIRTVQRSLHRDPLREETYHQLMRLHARNGDRAGIHRTYRACERTLAHEIGVEPGSETLQAYQHWSQYIQQTSVSLILTGDIPSGNTNLLSALDTLIGRNGEMEQIKALVTQRRLVTVTGFGGVGKTRLALASGLEMQGYFTDGVFWLDLAPLKDPKLVLYGLMSTLKVDDDPSRSQFEILSDFLKYKHILLIFDNCEHLLEKVSKLVNSLLQNCRNVFILATSRVRLRLVGETVYPLQPLPIPRKSGEMDVENESIQLFVERARAILPTFKLNDRNFPAVAKICRRLNGIPLAIELAAGRVSIITPQDIVNRLEADFSLLSGGSGSLPRHQTLTATLNWSHALLSQEEQTLFRRLAVFAGDFTLDDAETIVSEGKLAASQVLENMANLIDHSLVASEETGHSNFYRLHEVTRHYAMQKLNESAEVETFHRRHLKYYSQLAEEREYLLKGPHQIDWMKHIDREMGNFRVAIEWGLQQKSIQEVNQTIHLMSALYLYWWTRGRVVESFRWVERALQLAQGMVIDPVPLSKILIAAAAYEFLTGQLDKSEAYIVAAAQLTRNSGDLFVNAFVLKHVGIVALARNKFREAEAIFNEVLEIAKSQKDDWLISGALNELGNLYVAEGKLERAYQTHLEQLEISNNSGQIEGQLYASTNLSALALELGKLDAAGAFIEGAIFLNQKLEHPRGFAAILRDKARLAGLTNKAGDAKRLIYESLTACLKTYDWHSAVGILENFILVQRGILKPEQAVPLMSACQSARLQFDMPGLPNDAQRIADFLKDARLEFGEVSVDTWWNEGQKLSIPMAIQILGEKLL